LIPPAVEPGEPPMNISRIRMNLLEGAIAEMSTVLKPAVRAVTDWNRASSTPVFVVESLGFA
jgi:hypothetical protein